MTAEKPLGAAARKAAAARQLEERIRLLVEAAPPLDAETQARLAVLLAPVVRT